MAITRYAGDKYTGTSTDAKPTNVSNGAVFYETDTVKEYIKISGVWTLLSAVNGEVDGGNAASIYTVSQIADGGSA